MVSIGSVSFEKLPKQKQVIDSEYFSTIFLKIVQTWYHVICKLVITVQISFQLPNFISVNWFLILTLYICYHQIWVSSMGIMHVYITKSSLTSMHHFQGKDRQILKGRYSQNTEIKRIPIWKQQESGKSRWKWSWGINFQQLGSSCIRALAKWFYP